jgi:hypothetical protein
VLELDKVQLEGNCYISLAMLYISCIKAIEIGPFPQSEMAFRLPFLTHRRYALLAAAVVGAIWLWVARERLYKVHTVLSNLHFSGEAAEVLDVFDFPALESESIKSICGDVQWNESVVFTCDESYGGIGNIRNSVLNCVRYAISAGASLVLPNIVLRDSSDLSHLETGTNADMSYMFDTQHFLDSIRLSCPRLHIHLSKGDIKDFEKARNAISLVPESLVYQVPITGLPDPAAWRGQFYTWLKQFSTPEFAGPIIVDLGRSYLQYPIYSDGESFAMSFGSILKFRSDVRVLATRALQSLVDTHSLILDLTQDVHQNAFFGIHLRTEADAVKVWPAQDWVYSSYENQSKIYLEQAPRSNTSIIYVASGDRNEVAKFAIDASKAPNNFKVTTKFDLLKGGDLEELQRLAWDQQALVDYLVMLKASDFAGIGHSSFAWNVALKRHVFAKKRDHLNGPNSLNDELSVIHGTVREHPEYAACLWP